MVLDRDFYLNPDVVGVARNLIGKVLATEIDGLFTTGIIVETEAYQGANDKASHAWGGKITPRNRIMYMQGGVAYVYLCYGIHSLFNVVTNVEGIPHAVLIRGIVPLDGLQGMLKRIGNQSLTRNAGIGPGRVSRLLGIHYSHSGIPLTDSEVAGSEMKIWIEDRNLLIENEIQVTKRIGVDYAGDDALLPYRFLIDIKKAPKIGAFNFLQ